VIIKDRLIEVDIAEALALAGIGETVRCVGEGTGLIDLEDALEGLTFFVLEGKLAAREKLEEPIKIEASKSETAKLEDEIAKLAKSAFVPAASYDTPESRTRALIESVERYNGKHEEPAKQEALAKEYSGEEAPAPVPFVEAPTGGGR
jgi:hypothetical protein